MTELKLRAPESGLPVRPQSGTTPLVRGLVRAGVLGLIAIVTCVVVFEVRALWREYSFLRAEVALADLSAVVGYPGISPRVSYAERPRDWIRQQGDSVLLWADWVDGVGHRWYRTAPGDFDPAGLFVPHERFCAAA